MFNQILKITFGKLLLLLCLIFLQSYVIQAQLRTRTPLDSATAQKNGYWYNPMHYQFEVQYPKLQVIPPLSSGMDYETLLAYVFLDSLMRNTNRDIVYQQYLNRWNNQKTNNDTIAQAVKYLYKLLDYNPVSFNQYSESTSKPLYTINLITIKGMINGLLDHIVFHTPNQLSLKHLNLADYILRVHVNFIDSLHWIEYPNKQMKPNDYVYQVNAEVIDTLKGKVFQNCYVPTLISKQTENKSLTILNSICFTYATGPYSNGNDGYKIDQSLLNSSGNLTLLPGQDLIVILNHGNYLWDTNFDYFDLSLIGVFPILNGQVKDINHEWSNSLLLNYSDWKNAFLQKKNILLNGGY